MSTQRKLALSRKERRKREEDRKKNKRIKLLIMIVVIFAALFYNPTIEVINANSKYDKEIKSCKAKVNMIISNEYMKKELNKDKNISGVNLKEKSYILKQTVQVRIVNGRHKDETIEVENNYDPNMPFSFKIDKGDEVLISFESNEDGSIKAAYIYDFARDKGLKYIMITFALVMIIIGGLKGVKALITLSFTAAGVLYIFPKFLLKGYEPISLSILVSIIITVLTLIIVSGLNRKTAAAILGTSCGVIVAGIIAFIMGDVCRLTGLGSEEAQMLLYIPQKIGFNFKGLLFAGIVLGALGAVMDVSMSISSSMNEIIAVNPKISNRELFNSAMSVGRDIMGTMSNTLILAYAGASLQMIILLMAWDTPLFEIMNRDVIATEIVRSMAGSIGLIFAIPITALITIGFRKYYRKESHQK